MLETLVCALIAMEVRRVLFDVYRKVQETLALKEELEGHRTNLGRQVLALQTAIGVASYAVQLEQLER